MVPVNPGAMWTVSVCGGWLEAQESTKKMATSCTAKSCGIREDGLVIVVVMLTAPSKETHRPGAQEVK
jgi:hypothetical protein